MMRLNGYSLGGATLVCALGIGYVMQYGFALPSRGAAPQTSEIALTDITPTSSAVIGPQLPKDIVLEAVLPENGATTLPVALTLDDDQALDPALPQEQSETLPSCEIDMRATPVAGAMTQLTVKAPCRAGERITFHHQGLMFTELMQADGTLEVTVPALTERAAYIASFASGEGASARANVSSLPFYDRVAVQWRGSAGLQLHAREFTTEYFGDQHVWADASGNLAATARGESGFLVRLGREDIPDALVVEIYSFPTGTTQEVGDILLSVEAEVTDLNCGRTVEAQTLQLRDQQSLRVRNLALDIPACDSVGDFLVLKNLLEDLNIAAR